MDNRLVPSPDVSIIRLMPDISYQETGDGEISEGSSLLRRIWEISRPELDPPSRLELVMNDNPVSEFLSAILRIRCTVLEREIFTSTSRYSMWARTSRADSFENSWKFPLDLSSTISGFTSSLARIETYIADARLKRIQDNWRLLYPLSMITEFSIKLDFRSILILIRYFRYLAGLGNHLVYLYRMADSLERVAMEIIADYHSNVKDVVSKAVSGGKITKILNESFHPAYLHGVDRTYKSITIFTEIPLSLRAQIIRHRDLQVIDNLYEIITDPDCWIKDMNTEIQCQITGSTYTWQRILGNRTCWITHHGLSEKTANKVMDYLGPDEQPELPCTEDYCPFVSDAINRANNLDPNPPCPKFARISGIPLTKTQLTNVLVHAEDRPDFWKEIIDKAPVCS